MNKLIPRLYLNLDGLATLLGGEGQAAVFRAAQTPGTLRQVMDRVNLDYGPVAYTTVATIANKLCDKGILYRIKKHGNRVEYTYGTAYEEDALIDECVKAVIIKLRDEFPDYTSRACFEHVNQNPVKAK